MKDSGFRRISTMSGSYQIEGHASNLWGCDGATSRIRFNNQAVPVYLDPNPINNLRASDNLPNESLPASSHLNFDAQVQSSEGDSPEDLDFSDEVLMYINHILMEEDVEEKSCMFQESAALEAAEKSFKEVIGEQFPSSTDHQNSSNLDEFFKKNPDEKLFGLNDCHESLSHDWNSDRLVQSGPQYSLVHQVAVVLLLILQ